MRLQPTREFYIPAGSVKISPKCGGVVFYIYNRTDGLPCAMCFVGKAQKPTWRYAFTTAAKREAKIAAQIAHTTAEAESKAKRTEERNKPHGWEPGLILVSSWGYEQTNVDFFEVVRVVGKCFVEIEKIGSQRANNSPDGFASMSDHCMPDPAHRTGKVIKVKVQFGSRVSLSTYAGAHVWDGKPMYRSWYA